MDIRKELGRLRKWSIRGYYKDGCGCPLFRLHCKKKGVSEQEEFVRLRDAKVLTTCGSGSERPAFSSMVSPAWVGIITRLSQSLDKPPCWISSFCFAMDRKLYTPQKAYDYAEEKTYGHQKRTK